MQTTIKLETAVNFQHSQSVTIGLTLLWEDDPILFKDFITSLSYLRVKTIIKQLNKTEMHRIQSLRRLRKILEIFLLCVKHTDIRFPYKSELCSFLLAATHCCCDILQLFYLFSFDLLVVVKLLRQADIEEL